MNVIKPTARQSRRICARYSQFRALSTSPFAPRHFLSISDLSPSELSALVHSALKHKQRVKSGSQPEDVSRTLLGKTVALMFSKRSTRTRVSTEAAIAHMGGQPLFLGKEDIQLGVNESLYDTSVVISSMVSGIVARVNGHSDIAELAKYSSVPVINGLSDAFHPMQTIADFATIFESIPAQTPRSTIGLGLNGIKIAWIGDANNVLFDLAVASMMLGVDIAVATPRGYEIPQPMREIISHAQQDARTVAEFSETHVPEEAVKNADIIVTDTWVSMGQESEKTERLKAFDGFQITSDLAKRGGAKEGWQFMHCLPRHPEEVSDEVFFSPRSLVFKEAENRLYAAIAALEAFVVNGGNVNDA